MIVYETWCNGECYLAARKERDGRGGRALGTEQITIKFMPAPRVLQAAIGNRAEIMLLILKGATSYMPEYFFFVGGGGGGAVKKIRTNAPKTISPRQRRRTCKNWHNVFCFLFSFSFIISIVAICSQFAAKKKRKINKQTNKTKNKKQTGKVGQ